MVRTKLYENPSAYSGLAACCSRLNTDTSFASLGYAEQIRQLLLAPQLPTHNILTNSVSTYLNFAVMVLVLFPVLHVGCFSKL